MKKTLLECICVVLLAFFAAPGYAQYGIFDSIADWEGRGDIKVPGEVQVEGEGLDAVYDLWGNGDDIWDNQDEGLFLYTELEGSWTLQARVEWIDPGTHEWAKVGVMIRENPQDPESRHYWIELRGNNMGDRVDAQWRDETGGESFNEEIFFPDGHPLAGIPADASWDGGLWFRVTRIAPLNTFISEFSEDGEEWIAAHTHIQEWSSDVAGYGLAITDHTDTEQLAHARVTNVQLSQRIMPFDGPIFDYHMDIYETFDRLSIEGGAEYDPETETITMWGGGWDIWGSDDAGHFLFTEVTGDFELIATGRWDLERTTSNDDWIKMKLMAREDLTPGSVNYGSRVRRDGQYSWGKRAVADGGSDRGPVGGDGRVVFGDTGLGLEEWTMRIMREGDQFSVYYMDASGAWVEDQPETRPEQVVPMEDPIFVCLAVTAHQVGGVLAYAEFTNVELILAEPPVSVSDWALY